MKLIVNKNDMQRRVKKEKSETYNYTQSNLPVACVIDWSKVTKQIKSLNETSPKVYSNICTSTFKFLLYAMQI